MIQEQIWKGWRRVLYVPEGVVYSSSVQIDIPDADSTSFKDEIKADAFIYALWVDKKGRKKRLGTQMLNMAERIAKEHGCKSVSLEWTEGEAPEWVMQWYKKRGYENVAHKGDTWLMRKVLI